MTAPSSSLQDTNSGSVDGDEVSGLAILTAQSESEMAIKVKLPGNTELLSTMNSLSPDARPFDISPPPLPSMSVKEKLTYVPEPDHLMVYTPSLSLIPRASWSSLPLTVVTPPITVTVGRGMPGVGDEVTTSSVGLYPARPGHGKLARLDVPQPDAGR